MKIYKYGPYEKHLLTYALTNFQRKLLTFSQIVNGCTKKQCLSNDSLSNRIITLFGITFELYGHDKQYFNIPSMYSYCIIT